MHGDASIRGQGRLTDTAQKKMQFCWIGLQIEAINAGAVVLRRGFSTRICNLRRRKCALRIFETHPNSKPHVLNETWGLLLRRTQRWFFG
jgi:hypothetical protein